MKSRNFLWICHTPAFQPTPSNIFMGKILQRFDVLVAPMSVPCEILLSALSRDSLQLSSARTVPLICAVVILMPSKYHWMIEAFWVQLGILRGYHFSFVPKGFYTFGGIIQGKGY